MLLALAIPPSYNGYVMAEKLFFFVTLFGSLAFLGWLLARHHRSRSEVLRQHLDLRERVVMQAGSLEAFLAFARTEEGRQLLAFPGLDRPLLSGLRLLQAGTICLTLGVLIRLVRDSSQGLLMGGAGLGMILAGLMTRWLQARWVQPEDRD